MKKLTLLSLLAAGCMDYSLNQNKYELEDVVRDTGRSYIPGNPDLPEFTNDSGVEDTGSLPTYDPCDPYDLWAFPPSGTERTDCFGIEGFAKPHMDDQLAIGLFHGDCSDLGEKLGAMTTENVVGDEADVSLFVGTYGQCGENYLHYGYISNNTEEGSLSGIYVEEELKIRGEDESFSDYDEIPPLRVILDCQDGAEDIQTDCVAYMLK